MGIFSRKSNEDDRFARDEGEVWDQLKEEASHYRRVREFHNEKESARPTKSGQPTSGPSCDTATPPRPRRCW
ncbi:hypothetical protein [Streptomyces goshikiensis]|uniref:hypothetical protein n=1 Tax=Streptomyces goshikiensis TaxID=1942 RepID=UPI002ADF5340|nr:hypothetical protein [Streptomyces goshikiensis]